MSLIFEQSPDAKRAFIRFIAEHDGLIDGQVASAALADVGATTTAQIRSYEALVDALLTREQYLPGSRNIPSCCESRAEADIAVENVNSDITDYLLELVPDVKSRAA